MARFGREVGKVVWLDLGRASSVEAPTTVGGVAALFVFIIAICLAAELLAEAIAAWIGHQQSDALIFISTPGLI